MVLTQEWQSVATYQFSHDTGFSCTFYLDAKYSGQSTANITTTFQTRLRSVVNSGSGAGAPYKFTLSYANDIQGSSLWTYATETILEGQGTVRHNEDGTKSITLSATMFVSASLEKYKLNASMSATVDLPTIDRYSILITATDFNDESNPTITYTTNVGFQNATTYAGISLDGTTDNIPYRQVTISDGTYTFDDITEAQRNILRSATPNSNDLDVYFILKTVIGNDTYYSTPLKRKMSIINANPTVSYTVTETNQKVISLLGTNNANTLIKLVSAISIETTFSTKKYSTAKKFNLKEGTSDNVIQTYTTPNPTSPKTSTLYVSGYANGGKFIITLTDSRENATIQTDNQRTVLDYTQVKILNYSFKRYNPTSSNIILNAEFTYLSGIGNYANVPTVSWKLDDGSYVVIPSTNYSIDTTNNKLIISNYVLTNALNYKLNGNFTIKIEDLLTEAEDSGINGQVLAGIPTFDYGEHDLKVNGDLFIADEDGENKVNVLEKIQKTILWENQSPTSTFTTQNITLNTNDCDMLLWIFKRHKDGTILVSTTIINEYDVLISSVDSSGETVRRGAFYQTNNVYEIREATIGSSTTNNEWLVPLYVIGIKTGLF